MAFETFGLRWISQGAAAMARDIAHIAMGMSQFIGVSQRFEKQVLAAARAQVTAAAQQVAAADRAQRSLVNSINRQSAAVDNIIRRIGALITAHQRLNVSTEERRNLEQKILQENLKLISAQDKLADSEAELFHAGQESAKATQNYIDKQEQLAKITSESEEQMSGLSGAFTILLGKIFPSTSATMEFARAIGLSVPVGRALVVVLDVLSTTLDILRFAISAVIGVFGILLSIVTKIVGVLVNAGKAIASFVISSLWKLITLPFRLAWDGLSAIGNSLQRIGEIFIGMNLSNLIWNFGQQIRALVNRVTDAAISFQLLQVRMRGLIQREMSENEGISFSKSAEVATQRAKELSQWVSTLASTTIFNAADIADALTLAQSYDFTTEKSKELTLATVRFATAMGLGNDEIRRIIENFGQMRAQGKITGTELRDLARGAFVPVNSVLAQMAKDLKIDTSGMKDVKKGLQDMVTEGAAPLDAFFDAFIHLTGEQFPNALENANATMKVFLSNVGDFVDSVIGWRVVTPVLDEISKHLVDMLAPFLGPNFRQAAVSLGEALSSIVKSLFGGFNTTGFALQVNTVSVAVTNVLKSIMALSKLNLKGIFSGGLGANFVQQMGIKDLARDLRNLFSIFGPAAIGSTDKLANLITKILGNFQGVDFLTGLKASLPQFKEIGTMLWNDVIGPAFATAWSNLKTTVVGWWNDFIAPALQDLWDNHLKPWFTVLFETTIPAFWESTLKPKFIELLKKLGVWTDDNKDLGENVGLALVNGITNWLTENSGPGSAIVSQIASVLGSLLSIAATVALNTMSGIIIGSVGGTLKKEPKVSPTQLPDTFNRETEKAGGLSGAIEDLGKTTRAALDESLSEFKDWALTTSPGLNDIYKNADNIKGVLKDVSDILGSVVLLIGELTKTFINLRNPFLKSGNSNGITDDLEGLHFALSLINDILLFIIAPFKIFNDNLDALKRLLTGETNLGDLIEQHLTDPLRRFAKFLWDEWYGKIIGFFTNLWDELVRKSIIPDMMQDIYDAMFGKIAEISGLFDPANPESLTGKIIGFLSGIDLFSQGQRIATTLYEGIKSLAGQILALLSKLSGINITLSGTAGGVVGSVTDKGGGQTVSKTGVVGKAAGGADFIVPPGFDKDTFRLMVSSGERVIVIPKFDLARMVSKWNSPKNVVYGGSGNTYNTTQSPQYNLNVSTNRQLTSVVGEFHMMRLMGE